MLAKLFVTDAHSPWCEGNVLSLQSDTAVIQIAVLAHDVFRVFVDFSLDHGIGAPGGGRENIRTTHVVCGALDGPDMPLHGRRRDDYRPAFRSSMPLSGSFSHHYDAEQRLWTLSTEKITVSATLREKAASGPMPTSSSVRPAPSAPTLFQLDWRRTDAACTLVARDLGFAHDVVTPDRVANSPKLHVTAQLPGREFVYGLGEKTGPLDRSFCRFRNDCTDALGYRADSSDPLYKHHPWHIVFNFQTKQYHGILHDNLCTGEFDFGKEVSLSTLAPGIRTNRYRRFGFDHGLLDYYIVFGETLNEVVGKLCGLTGFPCAVPRWCFGYLGSTMEYTDAPNAQQKLHGFVERCKKEKVLCSMFHLSSGYATVAVGSGNKERGVLLVGEEDHLHDEEGAGIAEQAREEEKPREEEGPRHGIDLDWQQRPGGMVADATPFVVDGAHQVAQEPRPEEDVVPPRQTDAYDVVPLDVVPRPTDDVEDDVVPLGDCLRFILLTDIR